MGVAIDVIIETAELIVDACIWAPINEANVGIDLVAAEQIKQGTIH